MRAPQSAREIILGLPARFKSDQAEGIDFIVHIMASGIQGGDFTIIVNNSTCTVNEGLTETATCTVKTTAETYVGMENGKINPTMAIMTGKVKVSNIGQMIKFTALFKRLSPD